MEEAVKQAIIGLSGAVIALIGLIPAFIKRAQERRTREDLQVLARRAIDIAGDALAVLDRLLILESDADEFTKNLSVRLHVDYERILEEYRGKDRIQNVEKQVK